jgi:hypothetical protein
MAKDGLIQVCVFNSMGSSVLERPNTPSLSSSLILLYPEASRKKVVESAEGSSHTAMVGTTFQM